MLALAPMKLALGLVSLVLVAACGASTPEEPKNPASAIPAAAATPDNAPASTAASQNGRSDAPTVDQKAMRDQFMQSCTAKLPAPDYCDCSWVEFKKIFSGTEENIDPARMTQFQENVRTACVSKLPEDTVKTTFTTSCEGKSAKELHGYCACAWTELRKRVALSDFAGALDDQKGKAAKTEMIKSCGKQFPETVARREFETGCATTAENKPFCECAWKVIREKASAAEIAANMVDMETVKPKLQQSCAKLRK